MPDQVRHDDAITGWPALTQGPHSIIIISIETRWECDMADLFENPLGLAGFEFVEFSAPENGILEPVFESMGFTMIERPTSKAVPLWRPGWLNLNPNHAPQSHTATFATQTSP